LQWRSQLFVLRVDDENSQQFGRPGLAGVALTACRSPGHPRSSGPLVRFHRIVVDLAGNARDQWVPTFDTDTFCASLDRDAQMHAALLEQLRLLKQRSGNLLRQVGIRFRTDQDRGA